MIQIENMDVLEWCKNYKGEKFHALLCDPPYHLTSITDRFGKEGAAPAQFGSDGVFARASKGFLGTEWDRGDTAFRSETWAALSEHLLPGAFIVAFSGSRGWHRMACAMEDAGLIMHTSVFGWCNLAGFPKATRVKCDSRFEEHRYGGQAIKPAIEPILIFQKPYEGRPLDCITSTGAGALNIGAARIGTEKLTAHGGGSGSSQSMSGYLKPMEKGDSEHTGRWPANFVLDESGAELLDAQSGTIVARAGNRGLQPTGQHGAPPNLKDGTDTVRGHSDVGGASRMFHIANWNAEAQERIDNADAIKYCPKTSTVERNAGLNEHNIHPCLKPLALCKWLASLLLPPKEYESRLLVPFSGSGSEIIGAHLAGWNNITGIEQSAEYVQIAEKRVKYWTMNAGLFDELNSTDEPETEVQASLF